MIILGYDPTLDPIPPYDHASPRLWEGPSAMACDESGKWAGQCGAPDHPVLVRCAPVLNREHYANPNVEPEQPANQQPLFGAP